MGKYKINLKEYLIEYFIIAFGIIGGVLIAQRIEQLSNDATAKFIVGAFFIAFAAKLTAYQNRKNR